MNRYQIIVCCLALLILRGQGAVPAAAQAALPGTALAAAVEQARTLEPLETLIVAQHGEIVVEEGFRGHSTTQPTNVKSVSKTVISALVGIAIDKGVLPGPEAKIAPLLEDKLPSDPDPRLRAPPAPTTAVGWPAATGCARRWISPSPTIPAAACCTRPATATCCRRS